jgi:hypothetical protein
MILCLIRAAAAFLVIAGGAAAGQTSGLPATPPTTGVQPSAASSVSQARPGRRAEIVVSGNQIQVTANNSSLNAILREIARQTGMKITGGVSDERVYGSYGPAPASEVLASLLDGTGSNMILKMTASNTPDELILTPRSGGPSPPSPASGPVEDDVPDNPPPAPDARANPDTAPPPPRRGPGPQLPFSRPSNTPAITDPMATPVTPDPGGIISAPTVAPATEPGTTPGPATQSTGTSDPNAGTSPTTSPNGVKTPQQIYQELQQLQRQQQQQQQSNPQ